MIAPKNKNNFKKDAYYVEESWRDIVPFLKCRKKLTAKQKMTQRPFPTNKQTKLNLLSAIHLQYKPDFLLKKITRHVISGTSCSKTSNADLG